MEEILKRIEQVEHMRPDCIVCAFNKYINRCPEDVSASKKVDYMQRVMKRMSTASKSTAIPVIIRDIDKIRMEMFGYTDDFTEIKRHFNAMLLEQEDLFRERIGRADDPLMLAMQLALVGNYIDFGVVEVVDEAFLGQLIREAESKILDEKTYRTLREDLAKGGKLVYLTDNCGEIVMDKLLIEQIKTLFPNLSISVIVRGMDTMNDATMEDADQVGLTRMEEVNQVVGNGNNIMGTWLPETSGEAWSLLKEADVMIAKGQANFETLRCCGLNIYYLFLCKCELFAEMFQVPRLSGMLINDRDSRNK